MVRSIVAILALAFATLHASAQDFSTEELARRTVERRAVEAVIWGMPAVNYDLMLQEMLKDRQARSTRSSTGRARSTGTTRR